MNTQKRSFEKNKNLESILHKINTLLKPIEKEQIEFKGDDFSLPTIFQIGSPRSGTTFFTQWMASQGIFSYPTNFLSRFFGAPYIGSLIYEMLTNPEFDYRNEFYDISRSFKFESEIGKTKGFNAPHEFWYFWRQHFEFPDVPLDNYRFENSADFDSFNRELSLIKQVSGKPFLLKAHIVNWYLKSMAENLNNAVYIHIVRNPVANIRSLMKSRKKWTGSIDLWFSWKPKEFSIIKDMDAYHQVAGQIYFIEKNIIEDREFLGDRYLMFSYEDLCSNPEEVYYKVIDKVNKFSAHRIEKPYSGEKQFTISNPKTEFDDKKIEKAFQFFIDNYGDLKF